MNKNSNPLFTMIGTGIESVRDTGTGAIKVTFINSCYSRNAKLF